jgi:protein phosphatase
VSIATRPTEAPAETLRLAVGEMSDAAGREQNQDIAIAIPLEAVARPGDEPEDYLLVVADGMGGHLAGDVASELATNTLISAFADLPLDDIGQALKQAYRRANDAVYQAGQTDLSQTGMGTTLTTAVLRGKYATIANVGDSRAYLLRGDALTQVTRDHTVVADDVAAGRLRPEAAARDPRRNVLTHAIGTQAKLESRLPSIFELTLLPGDRLLLCTDGLYGVLDEADLRQDLQLADPEVAARSLVEQAKRRGTSDNATAIVAVAIPTRVPAALPPADAGRTGGVPGTVIFVAVAMLLVLLLVVAVFLLGVRP